MRKKKGEQKKMWNVILLPSHLGRKIEEIDSVNVSRTLVAQREWFVVSHVLFNFIINGTAAMTMTLSEFNSLKVHLELSQS